MIEVQIRDRNYLKYSKKEKSSLKASLIYASYFNGDLQMDYLVIGIGHSLHHGFAHGGVGVYRF